MIIPYEMIEPETLQSLIEEFVSRDGTDNGYDEVLSKRVAQVLSRLKSGEMVIVFDHGSRTPNILHKDVAKQILREQEASFDDNDSVPYRSSNQKRRPPWLQD